MEGKPALHSSWQMQALMCGCPMSVAIPSAGIFRTVFAYCQRLTCCLPVELCFEVYKHAFWCPYSIEGIVYFLFTSWLSFWSQAQLPKTSHLCCLFDWPLKDLHCCFRKHILWSPSDLQFWAFSWDEMAAYDLPASVDYILHSTRAPSLGYVGHSQGTTMGFAALSSQPQLAQQASLPLKCCAMTSLRIQCVVCRCSGVFHLTWSAHSSF